MAWTTRPKLTHQILDDARDAARWKGIAHLADDHVAAVEPVQRRHRGPARIVSFRGRPIGTA